MNASMILSFERDINDPLITFCPATLLARGDQNANIIKLTVMDGNAPADLSGNTAVVLFQRPGDSYVVRCPGSVSGNVISVTLLGDCYLYAGQYYASLMLDADGFTRTMLRIAGHIESNGDGPIIDPTGTIPGYEDIARIYADLEASLGRSDAATDSANAAAQNANEKAALANEAAGNANVAAGNANGATARANEASESIEGLTVEASDVSYDQPATATVTDVEGHKHVAFGLRQGVPGPVPSITFTGETGEPNTDVVVTQSGPPEAPIVTLRIPQGVPGTGNVSTVDGVGADSGENVALSAVRYVAQTLDDAQKVQARKNIGIDGQVYTCTAQALESMTQEQQAELYAQGYRAVQATNNETVVTLGLAADGSLAWQGCNQPRQNMLDNPNFSVAQAGYGGMHGTQVYAADRWAQTDGNATFSAAQGGGLTVAVSQPGHIYQKTQMAEQGKLYTIAASVNGTVYTESGTWPENGSAILTIFPGGTIYADADFGCVIYFESTFNIQWVRLLSGSYTPKTLPPWEAPDYIAEYLKCRRYYKALTSYGRIATKAQGEVLAAQVLSDQMRILPTAITDTLQVFDDTSTWTSIAVDSVTWMGDEYKIKFSSGGTISNGKMYLIKGLTGLSADL